MKHSIKIFLNKIIWQSRWKSDNENSMKPNAKIITFSPFEIYKIRYFICRLSTFCICQLICWYSLKGNSTAWNDFDDKSADDLFINVDVVRVISLRILSSLKRNIYSVEGFRFLAIVLSPKKKKTQIHSLRR